jgi:hypothetical protein
MIPHFDLFVNIEAIAFIRAFCKKNVSLDEKILTFGKM